MPKIILDSNGYYKKEETDNLHGGTPFCLSVLWDDYQAAVLYLSPLFESFASKSHPH
jgi:hypothetical protein